MKHARLAVVAALALAVVAAGSTATADPLDIGPEPWITTGTTAWQPASWGDVGFTIGEAEVYGTPADGAPVNDDAFDGQFSITVDGAAYGLPRCEGGGPCSYVVERTVDGGDVLLVAPVEVMSGLEVKVEHRYFAEGALARVLVSYRNPTAAPITVDTAASSDYGSDGVTVVEGRASVDALDRWVVTGDDENGQDPLVTSHFFGTGAALMPITNVSAGESEATFTLTVAPGATARLAFFVSLTGHVTDGPPDGPPDGPIDGPVDVVAAGEPTAAAAVLDTYDEAAAAAIAAAGTFSGVSGRAVAGIPAGTVLLNWGTVAGGVAPPATPATGGPAYTG